MKQKFIFYIITLLSFLLLSFIIEDTPLHQLITKLTNFTRDYPQEKVHLHLDKPYYAIGEDIWIKAYVVTSSKNEPSQLSKVLYVDLINSKNEVRKNIRLNLVNGLANGNINLIDSLSLSSGTYRIRAYTNYMRNYGDDFFFEKFISIGNVNDPIPSQTKLQKLGLDLKFFPESGNLVKGIRCKVGVKAVTSDGLGANLSGVIFNKNKEMVAEFVTEHAGMGAFAFIPQAGEKYMAIVTLTDGTTQSFSLPEVAESGFILAVNSAGENINARISASADLINGQEVYVIAQSNGMVYASFATKVDKANSVAIITKKSLPTGIIHFTLFNANQKPLAERLIFVNHQDDLKITVVNNKTNGGIMQKMDLGLIVKDINGNPVEANFSIAVTDAGKIKVNEDDEISILSNLLLTSDLKGYIEQPNYYFNEITPQKERQLDNLMLTQGWSRFIWQDITGNKDLNLSYRAEQSLEITGKITNLNDKPLANAKILLISNTPGYNLMIDTVADDKGNFVFDRLDIPDSASFIIQAKTERDKKNVKISVNENQFVKTKTLIGKSIDLLPYLEQTKALFKELQKNNMLDKGIQLNTVEIKGFKTKVAPIIKNSKNISNADYSINSEGLKNETDLYTALMRMPGILIRYNLIYRASNRTASISGNNPMLIILDGVQFNQADDPDFIRRINPDDVEGIEVITSNYNTVIYGPDGSSGVIHITTKHGAGGKYIPATNVVRLKNKGFSIKKEFYSPNYDDPKTNQKIQDLRSTVYWNPMVNTNQKGQASFNFFNASTPSTYRIVVEGLDIFGNIGRKVYTYQVK